MPFMCECRGPCREALDITPIQYSQLRVMGAVVTPECAERECRDVVWRNREISAVVAATIGRRLRLPRSAINPS